MPLIHRWLRSWSSAAPGDDLFDDAEDDFDVGPHGPVLDVVVVEAGSVGDVGVAAEAVDLRPAGQAGGARWRAM